MGQLAAEAASVLFEQNKHQSGASMVVEAARRKTYIVHWPKVHSDASRTHADLPAAAELGAVGISILLVQELTDLRIVQRSAKGSGVDYWLGKEGDSLFDHAARLEVSGIVKDADAVEGRVRQKLKQTERSAGTLPAFVSVVEFGQPKSVFKRKP